jgi:hypothetical protein
LLLISESRKAGFRIAIKNDQFDELTTTALEMLSITSCDSLLIRRASLRTIERSETCPPRIEVAKEG